MTAMGLLRAMSEIAPQDIEAALAAGEELPLSAAEPVLTGEIKPGRGAVIGSSIPDTAAAKHYRIGGIIAIAACLLLIVGAVMQFRQHDTGGLIPAGSLPDPIIEITGTEPAQTEDTSDTTAKTKPQTTAAVTEKIIITGSAAETETAAVTEEIPAETAPEAEPDAPETKSAEVTAATAATTAVTYAEKVPVSVAMADDAGALEQDITWELVTDRDAIEAYLNREWPKVTLGSGRKNNETAERILKSPALIHICWQKEQGLWTSYGICEARLDREGVLHLKIAMYSDGSPRPASGWVYETALLFEAGTLPPVTDVQPEFIYYEDTDETGIAGWLEYTAVLDEDIAISTEQ